MTHKNFFSLTGTIFLVIAALHLLRIINGWEAVIGGWIVPMWLSWAAVILAGYLGSQGIKLGRNIPSA